jgi:hypothetical protein
MPHNPHSSPKLPQTSLRPSPSFDKFKPSSAVPGDFASGRRSTTPSDRPHSYTALSPVLSGPFSSVIAFEPSASSAPAPVQSQGPQEIQRGIRRKFSEVSEEDASDDGDSGSNSGDNNNNNSRRHVCTTCNKRFNRPSSLKIHLNTHTGATRE